MLCGGASRRLGTDKAAIGVGGVVLAVVVGRVAAAAGAQRVVGIGARPAVASALRAEGMEVLADRRAGEGPAQGLVTALGAATAPLVAVLACDHPFLAPATIATMVAGVAGDPACAAAVAEAQGRLHPTVGVWRVDACLGPAEAYLAEGGRSLLGLCDAVGAVPVSVAAGEVVDVDTPADLEALRLTTDRASGGPGTLRGSNGDPAECGDVVRPAMQEGAPHVDPETELPTVDVDALVGFLPGAPLFDVRQPDEYAEGHIASAVLVPLAEVPDRVGEFPTDQTVYVVCRSGGRSANAVAFLRAAGVDAVNVEGGTLAWVEAGRAVVEGDQPG